jgi:D-3-phosphoglycerate dehydrogenase / 2-oxoglutarate reductase
LAFKYQHRAHEPTASAPAGSGWEDVLAKSGSSKFVVVGLDVWAPEVRKAILAEAPPQLSLKFADSFERTEQMRLAGEADFILAGRAAIDAEMIDAAKNLRFIQKWGIGIDRLDIEAARRRGIPVAIAAGSNSNPVSEHAVLLMLATLRRLPLVDSSARKGIWMSQEMRSVCMQLTGRTVGIVGFGNIGRLVALKLRGFDTRNLYYDTRRVDKVLERAFNVSYRALDELLTESDIVTLHAPLTADTQHIINADTLAKMKPSSILINTGRGGLVDENALYEALKAKTIFGAGLDVFDSEPIPDDHPFLGLDNVVITPHTSGAVFDNVPNVARHVLGNIMRVINGEELPAADVIIPGKH